MKRIDLIGKPIFVDDIIDDDEIEKALQMVREEFNQVSQIVGSRYSCQLPIENIDCGAIRWTWLTTLLRLKIRQLKKEEKDIDLPKTELHDIRLQIHSQKYFIPVCCNPFNEYFMRKAAKVISGRIYELGELGESGVSEDESVRQIAIELALQSIS